MLTAGPGSAQLGPFDLWLELETRCNLGCQFCFNHWKDGTHAPPRKLPTPELLTCLEDLLNTAECKSVALSGGEPLLHSELDRVLDFFSDHGIPAVLTTNGTRLDAARLDTLIKRGLTTVQVPLHSADPKTHDELSGAVCWHRSIEALALARKSKASVLAVFVATRPNVDHIEGVLELLFLLGIHHVIFNRFIPTGTGALNQQALNVPEADVIAALVRADAAAARLGSVIQLGVPVGLSAGERERLSRVKRSPCSAEGGRQALTVDAAGDLKHCNQSRWPVGNLRKNSARELLRRVTATRARLLQEDPQACYCATLNAVGAAS